MALYEIDGARFTTLEEFFDEVSRVLVPNQYWGRNFDAFNDILRGGFGTPDEGFTLRWKNSQRSREQLADFDDLVAIIRDHGPGGEQSEDNVQLELV